MSMGPLGAAGSPYAQRHGPDADRNIQETKDQRRRVQTDEKAELASGVGQTDGEDQFTSERDADGRRPWEAPRQRDDDSDAGAPDDTLPDDTLPDDGAPTAEDAEPDDTSGPSLDLSV